MRAAARPQRWQPRQYDVMKPPARTSVILRPAAGTRLAALVVDREEVADLLLEGRRDPLAQDVDGVRQRRTRRVVQRIDLLGREAGALAEGEQPRGMEDLVAVGVADAGHERLVAQQVLELARMAADPLAPDLTGEGRVVGIGTLLRLRPARGSRRSTPAGRR